MYHLDDTICAIATAPAGAARGIVRLSGPQVVEVLRRSWQGSTDQVDQQRTAALISGSLRLEGSGVDALQCDLYLWPNQQSYTRQPAAEIHAPGSPPLLNAALRTLCSAGARMALPG